MKRRLPLIGAGDAISANIHADDAASAFVAASEAGKRGLWHVTDDNPTTIRDMLFEFANQLGASAPRRIPLWLARLFVGKSVVEFFTRSTRTSNQLFRDEIGWSPRFSSFRAGLGEVLGTWRTEGFTGYLAGGLKPENVRDAIEQVGPFGLDICSGVRTGGKLDERKLSTFFEQLDSYR